MRPEIEKYFKILRKSELFLDLDLDAMLHIVTCLEGFIRVYKAGSVILPYGDRTEYAGVVLSGKISIVIPEEDGNEMNMGNIPEAGYFACANACIPGQTYPASAVAKKESKILFLKLSNLFKPYTRRCQYASMMTANVLRQIAEEKVIQDKRIRVMGQKSIRAKLISYISEFLEDGSNGIKTMNNQELANFLGVDRSALSREISRMRKEGILEYNEMKINNGYNVLKHKHED